MPTILLKKSDTPGSVPGTANLTNLAGGVEVAVNTADKRVYSMTSASAVIELGTNPSSLTCADVSATVLRSASATITNLIATSASITTLTNNPTFGAGTANGVLYLNASKVATSGSALTYNGTLFTNRPTSDANANIARFGVINSAGTDDAFLNISADAANNLITLDSTGNNTGAFAFSTGGGEKMRLSTAGDLGIGTASPSAKLTVNDSNNIPVRIGDISAAPASQTAVYVGSSTSALSGGNGDLVLIPRTSDARSILFYTGSGTASLRATLDSSGNLGLGVTPSAWSPQKAMQIASYTALADNPEGGGGFGLSSNAYEYSSGAYKYLISYYAALYRTYAGQHQWFTAPSGTAGNAISFTQAMTLDASGNLGVGITSPNSRLDVVGGTGIRVNEDGSSTKVIQVRSNFAGVGPAINVVTNDPLLLQTNNTERARITAGGDFLVGTTTANSTTGITLRADGVIVAKGIYNTLVSSNTRDIYMDDSGYFGYISSTRNSKTNIQDATDVSWLLALNPVSFNYKKFDREINAHVDEPANEVQYGLIAENVEAVKPELCFYDEVDGEQELRGVSYSKLITPMLKLIQQQQAAIAALEAKVAALETK